MFTFTQWLNDFLVKAAGHKYIKRIPYQSGGKRRYRYIYNVTHTHAGKHVLDPDHMKVGTKLMLDATSGKEVHGHITDVRGDLVSFEYDDGPRKGEVVTMGKERLAAELDKVHGISEKLSTARAKQKALVDKLKERGASEKQIAREQKRLDALGDEDTPLRTEEGKQTEPSNDAPDLAHARMMAQTGGSQPIGPAEYALYRHINNKADKATDAETRDRLRELARRFADASSAFQNHYGSREDRAKKKHAKRLVAWEAVKEFGGEDEAPVYEPPEQRTQKRESVKKPSKKAMDLLTASKKADTLKDGKRTRASFAADKKLIEHMGEVLDKLRSEIDPPDMIPVGERTPKQDLYTRLRGAVSTLRSYQKLSPRAYGSSQEDYKSNRAKARETILSVLNNLPQHGAGK